MEGREFNNGIQHLGEETAQAKSNAKARHNFIFIQKKTKKTNQFYDVSVIDLPRVQL